MQPDPLPRPTNTVWQCKVGCIGPLEVPQGGDAPMRDAVERAFRRTIGVDPEFTFSGWAAELTEGELAVVEDRPPERSKVTREVPYDVTDEMVDRAARAMFDAESLGVPGQRGYLQAYYEDADFVWRPRARAALSAAFDEEAKSATS